MAFAVEQGLPAIEPAHLLWALSDEQGSIGAELLKKAGAHADALRATLLDAPQPPLAPNGNVPDLAEETKQTIEKAVLAAHRHGHRYIGTEHLLFGLLELATPQVKERFPWLVLSESSLRQQLLLLFKNTKGFPDLPEAHEHTEEHEHGLPAMTEENDEETKMLALDYFAVELTNEEELKNIPPTIGREVEMDRLMHVLSRKTKNNPVLLGEPGVGKTAVVEGLARRMVEGHVPTALANKRIFQLDVGALIAGTMYRGDFEARMRQLLDELEEDDDVILFIDEIHTILGAGAASGSLDVANMLKPALARGNARIIGATTPAEYKRAIESDGALERRFEPIHVPEPTREQTQKMLEGARAFYETFHAVTYTPDALQAALTLSEKYLTTKRFPDKAIDLLDEAGAGAHLSNGLALPGKTIHQLRGAIEDISWKKKEAVLAQRFEEAQALRKEEVALKQQLEEREKWVPERKTVRITEAEIRKVVSRLTGISLTLLLEESVRLKDLPNALKKRVLGQDATVERVAHAVRRAKLGLSPARRPLVSFLFLGPSGVGKTELASALAETILHEPRAFLRLDMSEYAESYSVSKLLGSPAGYVGYRDRATLVDHVKQYPGAILLFDEIDKAHPDVQHLLLQILDHGILTDATGRQIHFHQTMIIATTNAGRETLERQNMGFTAETETAEQRDRRVRNALLDIFPPELVHRFDHLCVFHTLSETVMTQIVKKQLEELATRLINHQTTIDVQDAVINTLLKDLQKQSGAREIRRLLTTSLEHPIADHLLNCKKKPPHALRVTTGTKGAVALTCGR